MNNWIKIDGPQAPAYGEPVLLCVAVKGGLQYVEAGERSFTDVHGDWYKLYERNTTVKGEASESNLVLTHWMQMPAFPKE